MGEGELWTPGRGKKREGITKGENNLKPLKKKEKKKRLKYEIKGKKE